MGGHYFIPEHIMTFDVTLPDEVPVISTKEQEFCESKEKKVESGTMVDSESDSGVTENGTSGGVIHKDAAELVKSDVADIISNTDSSAVTIPVSALKKTGQTISKVGNSKKDLEKEPNDQELIIIQENLFNVKINAPGLDVFEVQVS